MERAAPQDLTNAPEGLETGKPKRRGGPQPGYGRPKGKLSKTTLDRIKVLEEIRQRVARNADQLLNAQMSLAVGNVLLFRVDQDEKGKELPAVQVTSAEEIKAYIDGDTEGECDYITAKLPDNKAIDSLLDRTFGKPEQSIDLKSKGKRLTAAPVIVSTIKPRDADSQDQAA
ncbi:hypothetical protein [Kineosporia sp. R_H_3]|uniref:hypothetical protein n=1 Tax=Kineosporia sp. R_H_3 TaxID=1961848 RepID=UPI00117B77D4|nr:hypothetical protein [Kineosporia sp. R_H_3]